MSASTSEVPHFQLHGAAACFKSFALSERNELTVDAGAALVGCGGVHAEPAGVCGAAGCGRGRLSAHRATYHGDFPGVDELCRSATVDRAASSTHRPLHHRVDMVDEIGDRSHRSLALGATGR